ncbi:hypothetical protein OESDEN_21236 [Oesophagostomum dentatum]|uniref:Uncharacterized protein n=1 Tax=Oesophagostomum dentatum TaxID=61180 RepID=A0A0B1S5K7_OESDE|nr:hypothetical protein OESDEN_21236 [Oesophagostomum dentatum]
MMYMMMLPWMMYGGYGYGGGYGGYGQTVATQTATNIGTGVGVGQQCVGPCVNGQCPARLHVHWRAVLQIGQHLGCKIDS